MHCVMRHIRAPTIIQAFFHWFGPDGISSSAPGCQTHCYRFVIRALGHSHHKLTSTGQEHPTILAVLEMLQPSRLATMICPFSRSLRSPRLPISPASNTTAWMDCSLTVTSYQILHHAPLLRNKPLSCHYLSKALKPQLSRCISEIKIIALDNTVCQMTLM